MSRTDKTRPLSVRVMDRRRNLEEFHDHTDGPCDLPPRPRGRAEMLWAPGDTRCGWVASLEWLCSGEAVCGCQAHSKKQSAWAQNEAAAEKTRKRRAVYGAQLDASTYGVDDLEDVPDLFGDVDAHGNDFYPEVDHLGHLAGLLDLPDGVLVVGVQGRVGERLCSECGTYDVMDGPVEVLYPDGRREVRSLDDPDFVVEVDRDRLDPYESLRSHP